MSAFSPIDIAAQIEGIEWVVILIIIAVLLLFGPSKLPELARGVGRALGEFRRGRMEIEREISTELSTLDARDMRMRVEKAAGALGVSAGGRSEMQLKLDIARVVTVGTWIDHPDLTKVDAVGFADLMPGSGHGSGGYINVGRIEVYGNPVKR